MSKKVLVLLFVLVSTTSVVCFSQQPLLDKKISIKSEGETLEKFLQDVEKAGGLTFVYNSSIIEKDRTVTYNASYKNISNILLDVLGNDYECTEYGTQVIIKKKSVPINEVAIKPRRKRSENEYMIRPPDTTFIQVYDTIYRTITDTSFVHVTDTVKKIDTVVVRRKIFAKTKKSRWNLSIAYTPYMSSQVTYFLNEDNRKYEDLVKSSENDYKGFFTGVFLDYPIGEFSFKTGLCYLNLYKDISYSFDKVYIDSSSLYMDTTSIWKFNTSVSYIKFNNGGDTVRITTYDSTLTKLSINNYKKKEESRSCNVSNILNYIQIPRSVGFPIPLSIRHWLTPVFSCRFYYLVAGSGSFFNYKNLDLEGISTRTLNRFMFAVGGSLLYSYRLHDYTKVFIEPTYSMFLTKMYKTDNAINESLSMFYVLIGLRTTLFEK